LEFRTYGYFQIQTSVAANPIRRQTFKGGNSNDTLNANSR
jgi:hypothetical protein